MILTATCSTCGKALKQLLLTLPARLEPPPRSTPTQNNCQSCGSRGAIINVEEGQHGEGS